MTAREALPEAWRVHPSAFPDDGPVAEKLRFLLGYAILAPSVRNSQPWRFAIRGESVELRADRARACPIVDPEGRELTLSCGAALFVLELAVRRFGGAPETTAFPDPGDSDLLARLRWAGAHTPDDALCRLFDMVRHRRTQQASVVPRELPESVPIGVATAVEAEGCWLGFVAPGEARAELARLVAVGTLIQAEDPAFRTELAAWIRPNRSAALDGVPGHALGFGDLLSHGAPWAIRRLSWGKGRAKRNQEAVETAPAMAVLGTAGDRPADWLAAGRALGHLLLVGRAENVYAGYFNQPVEVPELRARLAPLLEAEGAPQLVLRLGEAFEPRATPRRPVAEVLDED